MNDDQYAAFRGIKINVHNNAEVFGRCGLYR
jgi:hypothetical protein